MIFLLYKSDIRLSAGDIRATREVKDNQRFHVGDSTRDRKVLILIIYPPPLAPKTSVYAKVYAAGESAIIIAGVSATYGGRELLFSAR